MGMFKNLNSQITNYKQFKTFKVRFSPCFFGLAQALRIDDSSNSKITKPVTKQYEKTTSNRAFDPRNGLGGAGRLVYVFQPTQQFHRVRWSRQLFVLTSPRQLEDHQWFSQH